MVDIEGGPTELGQSGGEEYEEAEGLDDEVGNQRLAVDDLDDVQGLGSA